MCLKMGPHGLAVVLAWLPLEAQRALQAVVKGNRTDERRKLATAILIIII